MFAFDTNENKRFLHLKMVQIYIFLFFILQHAYSSSMVNGLSSGVLCGGVVIFFSLGQQGHLVIVSSVLKETLALLG